MSHSPSSSTSASARVDVRDFGATGDGRTHDTAAINRAIEFAALRPGAVVLLPAGDYLCHSLRLKSHLTLQIERGATLIAADPPPPGQPGGYDAPEDGPPNIYQDFGHSRFRNSLLWGEELTDLTICGEGRIYGRGLSRGNGRLALPVGDVAPPRGDELPDVLEADGVIVPEPTFAGTPGRFGYPHALDTLPAGVGNKAIALRGCRRVTIRGLTILHAGHFGVLATNCDDVVIEDLLVDTNRDGIDIDGCTRVRIERCRVNSPWDDGICIKSSVGGGVVRPVEDVLVANCYVSGFVEGTLADGTKLRHIQHRGGPLGRIKLGTEGSGGFRRIEVRDCEFEFCRGLAIEQVDGSFLEDVRVSGLRMRDVMNAPIFIRLGARLRAPDVHQPGNCRRISIRDVVAHNVAPDHGVFIAGLPGYPVEAVTLENIELHFRGGGSVAWANREVPELPASYPEPMLFGVLPAWAFYARHACDLRVVDLKVRAEAPDARPTLWLEDARDCAFERVSVDGEIGPRWELRASERINTGV